MAEEATGIRYHGKYYEFGGGSESGATFTPSVSPEGVISWTNDKGLPNPDPVNIKGPAGQNGSDGAKGDKGDKGDTGSTGATGNGIFTISKTSSSGGVDTYTITMTNGSTSTFTVTNYHETIQEVTMAASNWNNKMYSFESLYPSAQYNVEIEPNGTSVTDAQYKAWCSAQLVGTSTNVCKAMGEVPTVDIPIIVRAVKK